MTKDKRNGEGRQPRRRWFSRRRIVGVLIGLVGVALLALGLLAMSALNGGHGETETPPALYVIAFGGLLSGAACLIGAMLLIFGESSS